MPARPDEPEIHELLLQLDRLEEIREDLLDLGVSTLTEIEARIDELNRQLDMLEGETGERDEHDVEREPHAN